MSEYQQVWLPGPIDGVAFLSSVVGWATDSDIAAENSAAVAHAKQNGWLTTREHLTRRGDRWTSYALTEAGFSQLRRWSPAAYERARKAHEWYAESAATIRAALGRE